MIFVNFNTGNIMLLGEPISLHNFIYC